jgi:hypothetical protein
MKSQTQNVSARIMRAVAPWIPNDATPGSISANNTTKGRCQLRYTKKC